MQASILPAHSQGAAVRGCPTVDSPPDPGPAMERARGDAATVSSLWWRLRETGSSPTATCTCCRLPVHRLCSVSLFHCGAGREASQNSCSIAASSQAHRGSALPRSDDVAAASCTPFSGEVCQPCHPYGPTICPVRPPTVAALPAPQFPAVGWGTASGAYAQQPSS